VEALVTEATYPAPKRRPVAPAAGVTAAALAIMVAFTAAHEGEVRQTYVDHVGAGGAVLSYCYGETSGAVAGKTYTHEQCLAQLQASAREHFEDVAKCLPASLPDATAAAFGDGGYNLGSPTFCKSSMSSKALAGDLPGACDAFLLYVKSNGKDCRLAASKCGGIITRRHDERELCRSGLVEVAVAVVATPVPAVAVAPAPQSLAPPAPRQNWLQRLLARFK
jgi:lysozyme